MCKKLLCHRRLRRRNEYVHSAEVVPWQMFVATYAGMSIRKKNSSDVHIILFTHNIIITQPQIAPAVMPAQRSPALASSLGRCRRTDRPPAPAASASAAAEKEEEEAAARRTAADKRRERTRSGGIDATTSRRTRKRRRRRWQGGRQRTKRREMMRGGGVDVTTNRRTRDEGSDEEGEDGKGDGDAMVLAVMDGATVTA